MNNPENNNNNNNKAFYPLDKPFTVRNNTQKTLMLTIIALLLLTLLPRASASNTMPSRSTEDAPTEKGNTPSQNQPGRTQPHRAARERENLSKVQRASLDTKSPPRTEPNKKRPTPEAPRPKAQERTESKRTETRGKSKKKKKRRWREKKLARKHVSDFVVITQNLRGGFTKKLRNISMYLDKEDPDIWIGTETKALKNLMSEREKLRQQIPNYRIFLNGYSESNLKDLFFEEEVKKIESKKLDMRQHAEAIANIKVPYKYQGQGGVAALVHERIASFLDGEPECNQDARSVLVRLKLPKKKVSILAIYGPAEEGSERRKCWEAWEEVIEREQAKDDTEVILMGDLNLTSRSEDVWSKAARTNEGSALLSGLIERQTLIDAYCTLHTGEKNQRKGHTFTKMEKGEITYSSRIDAAITSHTLQELLESCEPMEQNCISEIPDHLPLRLALKAQPLGLHKPKVNKADHIIIKKINTNNFTKENIQKYQQEINDRLDDSQNIIEAFRGHLTSEDSKTRQDGLDFISSEITSTLKRAATKIYGEKEHRLNEERTWFSPTVERKRINLKRINRTIVTLFAEEGNLTKTKTWQKLEKNDFQYKPEARRRDTQNLSLENIEELKKELHRIQKKLSKELREDEKEETLRAIHDYMEELDKKMYEDPKTFYKRANIFKQSSGKQLKTVNMYDANGSVTGVESDPDKVKTLTFNYWKVMFEARQLPHDENEPWFETPAHREIRERLSKCSPEITKEITKKELREMILSFKKKKAPGTNELPAECIQEAPEKVLDYLLLIFNTVLRTQEIPSEWRESKLYTLHKGGDASNPSNYRPITLLNIQYKIFMKIIAQRTMRLLEEQKAFTNIQGGWRKNRATHQKIQLLVSAIQHTIDSEKKRIPIHIAYVDLSKAYDSVSHEYLFKTLEKSGFSDEFVNLMKKVSTGNICSVITPYGNTETYTLSRGVRQGCPFSTVLFSLLLEPCFRWIDEETGFSIEMQGEKVSVNMLGFADDMAILGSSHNNIEVKWKKLTRFCKAAGLTISNDPKSKEKTVYTHTGAELPNQPDLFTDEQEKHPIPKLLPHQSYKYLGVMVNLKLNWDEQAELCTKRLTRQLNHLRYSALDDTQVITCINKVLIPAILYRASVCVFSEKARRRWDALTSALVFNKMGLEKVSGRNYLFEEKKNGNGMGLISLQHMSSAAWIASAVQNGVMAADDDTRRITQLRFKSFGITNNTIKEMDAIGGRTKETIIKVIKNTNLEDNERKQIAKWITAPMRFTLEKAGLTSMEQVHVSGKLDTDALSKKLKKAEVETLIKEWTSLDGKTLHPAILNALGLHKVRPEVQKEMWQRNKLGFITAFPDGSYDDKSQSGTYAVSFGPRVKGFTTAIRKAYHSFETELRAVLDALRLLPIEENVSIYTDSESTITRLRLLMQNEELTGREKKSVKDVRLSKAIVDLLRQREEVGAETHVNFTYGHLRDINPNETLEKKALKEKREKEMWKTYEEETDMILEGNKRADQLTKEKGCLTCAAPYSTLDPEYVIVIKEKDTTGNARRQLYEELLRKDLKMNREHHPESYDWQTSDAIQAEPSFALQMDTNRKLRNTRNFQFKLRNGRLKTMSKMHERYKSSKPGTKYYQTVLKKYDTDICPGCKMEKEDTEHITHCDAFNAIRKAAGELLIKSVLDLLESPEPTTKQKLIEVLRGWLDGRAADEWKAKWTWRGYVSKNLWKTLEEQNWKDEQSPYSIVKKMQIIITEAIAECWFRRCKALHSKQADEQQMKKRSELAAQKVKGVKATRKSDEPKPDVSKDTVRTPLVSKAKVTQPRAQQPSNRDPHHHQETPRNEIQTKKRRERSPRRPMTDLYAAEAAASAEVMTVTSAAADDADELSLLTPLWILPPAKPPDKEGVQSKRAAGEPPSERPAQFARRSPPPTQREGEAEGEEEKAAAKRKRPESIQDAPPGPKKSGSKPT